jgi:hypothetical protein
MRGRTRQAEFGGGLEGFGVGEVALEVVDELGYVEAVGEGVVGVDGDGHRVAAVGFGDLAEGDFGGGVAEGEFAGVVDGGEVKPR